MRVKATTNAAKTRRNLPQRTQKTLARLTKNTKKRNFFIKKFQVLLYKELNLSLDAFDKKEFKNFIM